MASSGFALINPQIITDRLEEYDEQIDKLQKAFPEGCWPEVDKIPRKSLRNVEGEFYPGRVLIGQIDSAPGNRIWAYLWKIDCRGCAKLEFRNESADNRLMPKSMAFENIDFVKWCHLIASESSPVGREGPWQSKVKTIVKIALLKEGFFDGAMISDVEDIRCIVNTIRKTLKNREDRGLEILPSIEQPKTSMQVPRFATIIATLRDAFPNSSWFTVRPCHRYPDICRPGRVYIGSSGLKQVWAKIRKPSQSSARSPDIHYFSRGTKKVVLENITDQSIEFDTPFDLMRTSQDELDEDAGVWGERVAMGVRIAIINAGHVDLKYIKSLSESITIGNLITTVEKNQQNYMQQTQSQITEAPVVPAPSQTQCRVAGKLPTISRHRTNQLLTPSSDSPNTVGRHRERLDIDDTVIVAGPSSSPTLRRGTQSHRLALDTTPVIVSRKRSLDCGSTPALAGEPSQQRQRLHDSQGSIVKGPLSFLASMKEQLFTPTQTKEREDYVALKERISTLEQDLQSAQRKYTVHTTSALASQSVWQKKHEDQDTKYKTLEQKHARLAGKVTDANNQINDLKTRLAAVEAEKQTLEAFRAKHIKEAQPQLVSLMTMEKLHELKAGGKTLDGKDEQKARRDAERRYSAVYGVDVERTRYQPS